MRMSGSNRSLGLPDIDPSVALVQAMLTEKKREGDVPIGTRPMGASKAMARMRNQTFVSLLILLVLLLGMTSASSQVVACKPLLSTRTVREVRPSSPPPFPWRWHATILTDASFCATRSGRFEMDFVRIKEYSPDLQFTQAFRWTQNQFEISMELSPDEAILEFRIGFVAPCVCRATGELSIDPRVK